MTEHLEALLVPASNGTSSLGPKEDELRQIKDLHCLGITAVTDPKAGLSSCARK